MTAVADCIFCKVARGELPAPRLYEDDRFFCIRDIRPQAPVHLLVIPREHVRGLDTVFPAEGPSRPELMAGLFEAAGKVARSQGLLPDGYRAVINTGANGGQTVFHLHLHLLGGAALEAEFA